MNETYDFSKVTRVPHPLLRKKYAANGQIPLSGESGVSAKVLWIVVGDTLLAGSPEEIGALRCPECGGRLAYEFVKETGYIEIGCGGCGATSRYFLGCSIPNCAKDRETKISGVPENKQPAHSTSDSSLNMVALKLGV